MRAESIPTVMLFALVAMSVSVVCGQSRWPQFRGPSGTGVADDGKLPIHFGPKKNVFWKLDLPPGHSSPCVWDDRVFLTGFSDGKLETLCIDRQAGRVLWRRTAPAEEIEKVHQISNPAAPTPATDGQAIYVYFGSFGLLCYDFGGNELWKHPLPVPKLYFGTGTSPILAGQLALLNVDQQGDSYLLALNRRTGETVWKKERPLFGRGWSTPLHVRHNESDQVVVLGSSRLVAYDLKHGTEQWWVNGLPPFTISTPVVGDGTLFLAATDEFGEPDNVVQPPAFDVLAKQHDKNKDGKISKNEVPPELTVVDRRATSGAGDTKLRGWYFANVDRDKDGALSRQEWDKFVAEMAKWPDEFKVAVLAVRLGGEGDVTDTHVAWQARKGIPEVPSPLYYNHRIYTIKNGGIVFCRNAKTGKEIYKGRVGATGGYYSSPIAGDGKVYTASDRGVVTVLKAGDRLEVLARNDLDEPIMATPAIADGKLYVRTQRHLYAFGL